VEVLHRRLDVGVAHPLLHAPDVGLADHPRPEGVAQVVEDVVIEAGGAQRAVQAPRHALAVHRRAGHRVAEHERVIGLKARVLEVALERPADRVRQRHRARRALALRRAELAHHVVLADADARCRPVDVHPAQGEQLAEPQAGHRGRAVHDGVQLERVELEQGQRADLGRVGHGRELDADARVRARPATPHGEVEQRRERPDRVANRLRRQPLALHHGHEVGDVLDGDRVERLGAEERREVHARLGLDVAQGAGLAAAPLGVGQVARGELGDVERLAGARLGDRGAHEPTELALGLRPGQPLARSGLAHRADRALYRAPARAPASVPRAASGGAARTPSEPVP
jgi:hypothetical protein